MLTADNKGNVKHNSFLISKMQKMMIFLGHNKKTYIFPKHRHYNHRNLNKNHKINRNLKNRIYSNLNNN